jgi:glutaredoxin
MKDGQALQKVLTSMYNHSTVPYVFIKGKFIGGCSELKNLMKSSGINHSSHSYSLYQEDSDIE